MDEKTEKELTIIREICALLQPLPDKARVRVLRAVCILFDIGEEESK